MKKKLMFVFGTRPDTIKLAPLILKSQEQKTVFEVITIATAQHRQMLDDVLNFFKIKPDIDLNIMSPGQSLFHITSKILTEMDKVISIYQPDIIVVQGDTTTTYAAALSGFYYKKQIAHVEAGLRTYNKWQPFPEEINRRMTSAIADYHFAPTEVSKLNLLRENFPEGKIFVTGNTVIDALFWAVEKVKDIKCPIKDFEQSLNKFKKMILITGHRRENFGDPFKRICEAFKKIAHDNPDVIFVYPVHLNPNVQKPVSEILSGIPNFFLLNPLPYPDFIWFMEKSYFIISDSGGIQEEAPALGKPVLVTRKVTERPEAVEAGAIKLVGDDYDLIVMLANRLINDPKFYSSMSVVNSPYGDGKASEKILSILSK